MKMNPHLYPFKNRRAGFALIFVMVVLSLFAGSAYSILTRYDNDVRSAVRNMDSIGAYYWQESRLRLIRYKFAIELTRNGANWDYSQQQAALQQITDEVLPKDPTFDWRNSLTTPNGGYVSKQTYNN